MLGACGYHSLASHRPFALHSVAVATFLERDIAGVAPELSSTMATALASAGMKVMNSEGAAEATLTGSIDDVESSPTPGLRDAVASYTVGFSAKAQLRRQGVVLWQHSVRVRDDFLADINGDLNSPLVSEARRREAMQRLAKRAATMLVDHLMISGTLGTSS